MLKIENRRTIACNTFLVPSSPSPSSPSLYLFSTYLSLFFFFLFCLLFFFVLLSCVIIFLLCSFSSPALSLSLSLSLSLFFSFSLSSSSSPFFSCSYSFSCSFAFSYSFSYAFVLSFSLARSLVCEFDPSACAQNHLGRDAARRGVATASQPCEPFAHCGRVNPQKLVFWFSDIHLPRATLCGRPSTPRMSFICSLRSHGPLCAFGGYVGRP